MNNENYHTVGTFQSPIEKSLKEEEQIPLTHKCMIAPFPGLVEALQ